MKTAKEWRQNHILGGMGFSVMELIHNVQNDAIAYARQECAVEVERLQKLADDRLCDVEARDAQKGQLEDQIERLKAELAESRDETEGWITLATDAQQERDEARGEVSRLQAELATLRAQQNADHIDINRLRDLVDERDKQIEALRPELARVMQPPAPAPQGPAESPIDKAAREAFGCGHTEDADGRSQIPRCIRETVERLENEIHALKTADMSGSGI